MPKMMGRVNMDMLADIFYRTSTRCLRLNGVVRHDMLSSHSYSFSYYDENASWIDGERRGANIIRRRIEMKVMQTNACENRLLNKGRWTS
jgi:hypothetical protein